MTDKVAVIIPFYQEEPGILRRAIESVWAQTGVSDIEVIVVDDGSPVSAVREVAGLPPSPRIAIPIIEQENAGPGAARNAGLDSLEEGTKYIAFLDSDDAWCADHLSRAVSTLEQGYDFYFANYYGIDQQTSDFDRPPAFAPLDDETIPVLDNLYKFRSNMFRQEILRPIVHTSTVVYRRSSLEPLRFEERLTHSSEDTLFWLGAAEMTVRFAYSSRPECRRGRGANVFRGRRWGTHRALQTYASEILYSKLLRKRYLLDKDLTPIVSKNLRLARKNFATSVLHMVRHRREIRPLYVISHFCRDPLSLSSCFYETGRITLKRLCLGRRRFQN